MEKIYKKMWYVLLATTAILSWTLTHTNSEELPIWLTFLAGISMATLVITTAEALYNNKTTP